MEDDDDDKHDDQHSNDHNDSNPPHSSDPINGLLNPNRVQKEVGQSVERSIIVHDHTLVEEVAVTGKVAARKTNLQVLSSPIG